MERICEGCGQAFRTDPGEVAKNHGRFCSRSCWHTFLGRNCPTHICQTCGVEFRHRKKDARFCSPQCYHTSHRSTVELRPCPVCGQTFRPRPAALHRGEGRYCSVQCGTLSHERWVEIPCAQCGQTIFHKPNKLGRARYCSATCYKAQRRAQFTGTGNPTWNGGSSFLPYPPTFTEAFKRRIRERDHYRCALCGAADSTQVHHIDYIKEHTTPENCITLCSHCHSRTNHRRAFWLTLCREIQLLRSWA